jgi:WD40 repeat protein
MQRFLEPHKDNSFRIVGTVAFSPDGRILASNKGRARLWDVRSGKLLRDLDESLFGPICTMDFAPDGKTLALATLKGVWLYDLATGKGIRPFPGHTEIRAVGFSKDGKVLASGSNDKTVRIWDLATGKEIHRFEPHDSVVQVALAPSGNLVAAQTTKEVLLWEVTTGREVRRFQAERQLRSLAFSPDGTRLASANLVWDLTTGKEVCRLEGIPSSGLAWGPNGKTLVSVTGAAEAMVSGALAFAPDGTVLATGGYDGVVRLHDPATGKELPQVKNFSWNRGYMNLCGFAPDGRWLAVRDNGGIHLCETTSGREIHWLPMGDDHGASLQPLPVALAPDGRTVLAAGAEAIYQWDTTTGKELRRIPRRKREDEKPMMAALAFAPDGQTFACAHYEPTIRLWDRSSGKQLREFQGDQNGVYHLFFFPDGKTLVSESLNHNFPGSPPSVYVRIWDLTTGKELREWRLQSGFVQAFSPDGKMVAVYVTESNKPALALRDLATGKQLRRIAIQAAEGGGFQDARSIYCAFSPDGRLLAVDADPVYYPDHKRTTQLLEVASGKVRARFAGHFGFPGPMMFSPDGKVLASGSSDTTALIWDVTGRMNDGHLRTEPLTPDGLKTLRTDLGADNGQIAHRAIWALAAAPDQAVPLLKEKLLPIQGDTPSQVTRMIEELDSNQFAVREKAAAELEELENSAEPALRQALADNPSLEVRRRIEQLLGKLDVSPERLQKLRALEVLEHIATPEAREVLLALAQGAPKSRLTQEAKASLEQLNKRVPVK